MVPITSVSLVYETLDKSQMPSGNMVSLTSLSLVYETLDKADALRAYGTYDRSVPGI